MGKLRLMQPVLRSLAPKIAYTQDARATDKRIIPPAIFKRWYKTARWQKLRWSTFVRDLFTCQMCGKVEANTRFLVADHRKPHRGDERLFWDPANIQTLCADPCHNTHKQKLEQQQAMRG